MNMSATLQVRFREHWRELRRGRPGHRFQDHYERAREEGRSGAGERIVLVTVAVLCLAIGAVLSVIPGPALPFFFLAGGLLATESRWVARFMDWSEVRMRKIAGWLKHHWRQLPFVARIVLLVIGACCSAATGYWGYKVFTG
jgi:hypothetical protein